MRYEDNPKSIKYYVKRFLLKHQNEFKDKTVIDMPAGSGVTSRLLGEVGATPIPVDIFPEYFKECGAEVQCIKADIMSGLPVEDKKADFFICQEGIEHFSDQYKFFQEANRVLKDKGILLLTTPNYSNLCSKISYLLSESERYLSQSPPNESDSIWMKDDGGSDRLYFGHVFLIGICKLRLLAKVSGFDIQSFEKTRLQRTSLLFFIILYPLILLANCVLLAKKILKNKNFRNPQKKQIYVDLFFLSINPAILLSTHLFIVFKKTKEPTKVIADLEGLYREFGNT